MTVFVVVDMLTKMAHFIPCRGLPSARATARMFIQQVFRLHGFPDKVMSDRGAQFTARFWQELMQALDVKICLLSAHHPQTDGGTEKVIGILEQYLCCYVNQQQNNWVDYLAVAEFAFNNSQHTSTQMTPFLANVGYHPRFFPLSPLDALEPPVNNYLAELQAIHRLVQRQLEKVKADYKRFADRSRRDTPPLSVGDRVWLSTRNLPSTRPTKKLDHRYVGPFPIEAVINPVAYRLTLPRSMWVHPVFHRSLLVPEQLACPLRRAEPPPPEQRDGDSAPEYQVVSIRDSCWVKGRFQYLIEWKGYGPEEFTWEDASTVHAPALVTTFHEQFPSRPHLDQQTWGKGPAVRDSVVIQCQPVLPKAESEESEEEVEEAFEGPSEPEGGSEVQDSQLDAEPGPSSHISDEAQLGEEHASDLEESQQMDLLLDARRRRQLARVRQQRSMKHLQSKKKRQGETLP
ncbi:PEG10: Retrotransposon-derived protein PEG10 [Crotalus adamanteus]|uniref:PEG10: Retrotransposon-derived protein PEG10 n=1 Tax=Crotalus adamanteus TaxID=8729 RepID=A0AAW1BD12_CROAD